MATYYVELNGGELSPKTTLKGGGLVPSVSFSGAEIYPVGGGGGSATLQTKSVTYTPSTSQQTEQVTPDAGYDGLDKVNVTVDAVASGSVAVDTKTITVTSPFSFNASTGKISSHILNTVQGTATVTPGYVDSATPGDIHVYTNKDQQLDVVGATTYTPSTTDQTIPAQKYLTGAQTILGDANLLPENIKKDVSIFGKVGTYEGSGGGLDVNAVAMRTAPSGAVVLDTATDVAAYVFYRGHITSVVSHSVVTLKAYSFALDNLTNASFYAATTLEDHVFNYATPMTATFPKVTNFGTYTFQNCASGAFVIDIGKTLSSFANTTFYGTDNMTSCILILRRTAGVVTAPGLDGIPKPLWNANKTGTLYVPQALLASYQTASNWSTAYGTANTTFLAIEGSPYENYYADGTPIS